MSRRREVLTVAGVSAYMLGVAGWLRVTRRIRPRRSLAGLVLDQGRTNALALGSRLLGREPSGELTRITHWKGLCFESWLPWWVRWVESDHYGSSGLQLFEDGHPLGPAHQTHDVIALAGEGRYSHWGPLVRFASSDGTDPRWNGRRYTYRVVPAGRGEA